MTSDDEVTSFFDRIARPVANGSAARPRKRRKSSHGTAADDSSSATESSSDVEIVGSSAAKQRSAANGKGKGKAMAPQPLRRAKQVDKPSRRAKEVSLLSSDSASSDSDELPSATQIDAHGAALLAMARSKGYAGTTPPRRAKRQEKRVEPSNMTKRRGQDESGSSSSEDSAELRRPRRKSNSTELTTVSDRSSSATKTKASTSVARTRKAVPTKSATTKAASTGRRQKTASPSLSPSPQLEQPPEPQSFWQIEAQPAPGRGAKRQKHGEASSKLKALSERGKMLVLPDDEEEDEIVGSSSSASDGPRRYETVAAKAKREKEEAIAALKAKRGRQSLPLQDAPNGAAPRASPRKKDNGKGKALAEPTGQCPVCSEEVALKDLEVHASACLALFEDVSDTQQQAAPPGRAAQPAVPGAGTSSAFRPAGASASAASASRAQANRPPPAAKAGPPARSSGENGLANELFPSSPPVQRNTRATVSAKGKGRAATLVEDSDEHVGRSGARPGAGQCRQEYAGSLDGEVDGYIDSEAYVDADTSLHKTVVELSDDDDEDDIVIADVSRDAVAGPSRVRGDVGGPSRVRGDVGGGKDGREGAVNTTRAKGPPENGSSPPRGSIYVSMLGRAYREGYENLFTTATKSKSGSRALPGLGNNDVDDADAHAFDALALPVKSTGRGRGGGGGGRKASGGGGRKASWGSWRGRRGRGRK
ncbi:proteophosphoglycan ppg4 [Rhodotorula toruloides]|uniref:Proteophosphoglycan ppg4 n=1 Tax=Rhodotorula toruloides TaxID=5286 RepID=A0A511KHL5_RHOTO|nr:proteophosphoglycan ppg4 [Rhodotorula toruloides]